MTPTKVLLTGLLLAGSVLSGCDVYVARPGIPGVQVISPRPAPGDGLSPIIQSFTSSPMGTIPKGQLVTFSVVASDPGNSPIQYNWSATGGTLSGNAGQVVSWDPPEAPGLYTVSVILTNSRGGAVTGSQNLRVKEDGTATLVAAPAKSPAPTEAGATAPTDAGATAPTQTAAN